MFRYFLCDCLNFVNVIGQMYFVDKFLGGVFMTYGTEVISFANTDDEQRTDPMMTVIQENFAMLCTRNFFASPRLKLNICNVSRVNNCAADLSPVLGLKGGEGDRNGG